VACCRSTAPRNSPTGIPALKGLVLHHAASHQVDREGIFGIARYHVGPNHISSTGCPGICYPRAITGDGVIHQLHDLDVATWSQGWRRRPGDENADYLGVLIMGFFKSPTYPHEGEPTLAQLRTVLNLWDACRDVWTTWRTGPAIMGHFDLGKPACPGTTLETLIRALRANQPAAAVPGVDLNTTKGRQRFLADAGHYRGQIDGIWGHRSKQALIDFQRTAGLVPDGIWGPRTEAAALEFMQ